jgi:hypothetical protein
VEAATRAAGVCPRTARKWPARFLDERVDAAVLAAEADPERDDPEETVEVEA